MVGRHAESVARPVDIEQVAVHEVALGRHRDGVARSVDEGAPQFPAVVNPPFEDDAEVVAAVIPGGKGQAVIQVCEEAIGSAPGVPQPTRPFSPPALEEEFGTVAGARPEDEVVVDVVADVVLRRAAVGVGDEVVQPLVVDLDGALDVAVGAKVAEPARRDLRAVLRSDPVGAGQPDVTGQGGGRELGKVDVLQVAPDARLNGASRSRFQPHGESGLEARDRSVKQAVRGHDVPGGVADFFRVLGGGQRVALLGRYIAGEGARLDEAAPPEARIDAQGVGYVEFILHV